MNADLVNSLGDYSIGICEFLKLNGLGFDFRAQVESITIHEDIFSPFSVGEIAVRDTLDLPNLIGRSGRDLLRLRLETPSLPPDKWIDGMFFIYKISERTPLRDRMQGYKIHFASEEILADMNTRLSKRYLGRCDEVVTKLYQELKTNKKLNTDASSNSTAFVSNFWTPSKCFTFVQNHAIGPKRTPSYLFFENRDGFNFKEVASLFDKEVPVSWKFKTSDYISDVSESGRDTGKSAVDINRSYASILGIRIDVNFDYLKDFMGGVVRSKSYSSDIVTKKIKATSYSMKDISVGLNERKLYPDGVIDLAGPVIANKNRGYGTFGPSEYSNYASYQKRAGLIHGINSSKIEIDVYGRTDYTVGRKVRFDANQMKEITKKDDPSEFLDKLFSGLYIITAVSHRFSGEGYRCTLELSKESTIAV